MRSRALHIPLCLNLSLFLLVLISGCQSSETFVTSAKKEIAEFEKWSWGKSFDSEHDYSLSGLTWKAKVSVTPGGSRCLVVRKNNLEKEASLTIREFSNCNEGWLFSAAEKKFAGKGTCTLTHSKDGFLAAGLSNFTGDLSMGIVFGKRLSHYVSESKVEMINYKKNGKTIKGISCIHQKHPDIDFQFDENMNLSYAIIRTEKGDIIAQTKFGPEVQYEGVLLKKETYGPFRYQTVGGQKVLKSFRRKHDDSPDSQITYVKIFDVTENTDSFRYDLPIPEEDLPSDKQVQSNATDGTAYFIKDSQLGVVKMDGTTEKLNHSAEYLPGSGQFFTLWIILLATIAVVAGLFAINRLYKKKKELDHPTGDQFPNSESSN